MKLAKTTGEYELKRKSMIIDCPVCGGEIKIFDFTRRGDTVLCDGCGNRFELLSFRPVKLKLLSRKDWGDLDGELD